MITKQFKFPTFAQWATESYRRMVDKDLFGPTSMGRIEENIAEEFFKEWRRFYALDFLSSLAKFVNDGWKCGDYYSQDYERFELLYCTRYMEWEAYEVPLTSGHWKADILNFQTRSKAYRFLEYEGCGTTTKEQLNILYNIDQ